MPVNSSKRDSGRTQGSRRTCAHAFFMTSTIRVLSTKLNEKNRDIDQYEQRSIEEIQF